MNALYTFRQAWNSSFVFKKQRDEALWARLAIAAALALGAGAALTLVSVLLMGVADAGWWRGALFNNMLLGGATAAVMLVVWRAAEWLLPARLLDALEAAQDWRSIALASVVLLLGLGLGIRLSYVLLGQVYNFDVWKKLSGIPLVQLKFLIFMLLLMAANWMWWLLRAKERALAHHALESQLRMLQAQIEPHFLFNTLANVQSLIASDASRAQRMLESFTDYLRASLGQMRNGDSTLALELETARNYLELMQVRMESRLAFSIEASAEAQLAALPPLLLQPLVENAVQHGLEPKIEGGAVSVAAAVRDGRLEIVVADDGVGLDARKRTRRTGHGVALKNIGARLEALYGRRAGLVLESCGPGTRAVLTLPHFSSQKKSP